MTVALLPVKSSNVEKIGYDKDAAELHVVFRGGNHYIYSGVPPQVHADFLNAESAGKHFIAHIKDRYPHRPPEAKPEK